MTPDQHIAAATEIAREQWERFASFAKHFHLDDTDTDVLREFYKDANEAHKTRTIAAHLLAAEEAKGQTTK